MAGKVAVVFGGGGFMGSHTADELTRRGFAVVVFDRVPSPWLHPSQRMVVGDILDRDMVRAAVRGANYVYHYAGVADIAEAAEFPFETIEANVMGAATVLQAAAEEGVERFVYASSMYVYSPYGSFYRASKQAAEIIIEAYHEKFGMDYVLLRYGSLYGPRAQSWNGLKGYVGQVVKKGRLKLWADGQHRREYIHVRDAARLSVDVLDDQHRNQAITVTGIQVLRARELAEMIFEIAGVRANIEFEPGLADETHYVATPYRYTPKPAKKLVPDEFVDIGQGILDLVEEIHAELDRPQT